MGSIITAQPLYHHNQAPLPRRVRRISRRRERSPLAIAAAIPAGSTKVRRLSTYVDLVEAQADLAMVRADRREKLRRLALALLQRSSTSGDGTTMPTWDWLAEQVGCHRSTVARLLALLRQWGLLGIVATGRSAACAPGGPLSRTKVHHTAVADYAGGQNEAAIYVLCQPRHLAVVEGHEAAQVHPGSEAVDTTATPPRLRANPVPRTRAREGSVPQSEPRKRGHLPEGAAQARPNLTPGAYRPGSHYSATATISGKDAALAASRELQARLPVLRRISPQHVRSVVREFFLAGWTVSDVIIAIDSKPSGHRWPHDGAHAVDNVGAWLAHRLRPWRTPEGIVRRSISQRAAAERTEALARAAARREEAERWRRARQERRGASPAREAAMALARALRHRRRLSY